VLPH